MIQKRLLGFVINSIFALFTYAQNGTIRGTVIEGDNGEPLFGVTVQIKGTTNGAITDFDGKFSISATPGNYDLQVSFVSFQTVTISGLLVEADKVTLIDQIRLEEDVELLDEVVITAEVIKTTEAALLTVKRKSANVMDGISAASFRKIGDSDAAEAIKRIPGISVQGGKYVFVRGLGDRYTKTILNGMEVPGLDPDRNSLQLDVFPTNIIDNLIVLKSFTADLPADFTGGVVNIETKNFPAGKEIGVSISLGFNPNMHFNNEYRTYKGSNSDFLGFDDGRRNIPVSPDFQIPSPSTGSQQLTDITESFDPVMAATQQTSGMDFGVGFSLGNQIEKEKITIGYIGSLSYRNETTFYDDAQNNIYLKPADALENELVVDRDQSGSLGINSSFISGLAGGSIKTEKAKYSLNLMRLQNGESRAGQFDRQVFIFSNNISQRDALDWSERTISNALLNGTHYFNDSKWTIDWKFSPTLSSIDDKDVRVLPFTINDDGIFQININEGGDGQRIWRSLEETNYAGKADITNKYKFNGTDAKFKFGGSYTYKLRDYSIATFRIRVDAQSNITWTGDANEVFESQNIWMPEQDFGTYMVNNTDPSNTYSAESQNFGIYVSNEANLIDKLKTVIGVRMESFIQWYTGLDQRAAVGDPDGQVFDNERVIDELDFFPTVNLIYSLQERTNLRASFSRTIARPSFKEASIAQIFDPISSITFIGGNRQLAATNDGRIESTYINNFDLRYEVFLEDAQTYSISAFYKTFENPIELTVFDAANPDTFQPRNLGDSRLYGIELEVRKNLGFLTPAFDNILLNTNVSFIQSELEMGPLELDSRISSARVGENVDDTRKMQGQSPYLINVGLSYNSDDGKLDAGFYYNVQGRRLAVIGLGRNADVYDDPFHSLNFKAIKSLGKNQQSQLSLSVNNILGDKRDQTYESFGSPNFIFSRRNPGTSFSLGFGHKF
ncbi:MAG: TonB-dependent receptor [Ekhidna sp.]|nr:TonB-dependent receptor [Ekhidna sp.]